MFFPSAIESCKNLLLFILVSLCSLCAKVNMFDNEGFLPQLSIFLSFAMYFSLNRERRSKSTGRIDEEVSLNSRVNKRGLLQPATRRIVGGS